MLDKSTRTCEQGFQMNVIQLLKKKRDGGEFTSHEIEYLISCLIGGEVADSQIGAMLMAMYLQGLSDIETTHLTRSMVFSGRQLQWKCEWQGLLVDKHSTGGVGDKISLILAPILAACGLKVPMMSGRSLEHTGGTLDKLESIPGFVVDLDEEMMCKALDNVGCFIAAATNDVCPADKILYRIRDITSTVDSMSLIVPSIISKKVASGTKFLVVDVKVGKAAFCKTVEMGRALAKQLIAVSAQLGVATQVILSRMDEPLGNTVGNSLEVAEAMECLSGNMSPQIARLIAVLGSSLLQMTKQCADASQMIQKVIQDGSALDRFCRMLVMQGVNEETVQRLVKGEQVLPRAKYTTKCKAQMSGWVSDIDAMKVGHVCQYLGACRLSTSSQIDPSVGVELNRHVGDVVGEGEVWLTVHHSSPNLPQEVVNCLQQALTVVTSEVKQQDIIIEVIQ